MPGKGKLPPKFKGRRFTAEPVVVWRVWDALDQEYLHCDFVHEELEYDEGEERATLIADGLESDRPM